MYTSQLDQVKYLNYSGKSWNALSKNVYTSIYTVYLLRTCSRKYLFSTKTNNIAVFKNLYLFDTASSVRTKLIIAKSNSDQNQWPFLFYFFPCGFIIHSKRNNMFWRSSAHPYKKTIFFSQYFFLFTCIYEKRKYKKPSSFEVFFLRFTDLLSREQKSYLCAYNLVYIYVSVFFSRSIVNELCKWSIKRILVFSLYLYNRVRSTEWSWEKGVYNILFILGNVFVKL